MNQLFFGPLSFFYFLKSSLKSVHNFESLLTKCNGCQIISLTGKHPLTFFCLMKFYFSCIFATINCATAELKIGLSVFCSDMSNHSCCCPARFVRVNETNTSLVLCGKRKLHSTLAMLQRTVYWFANHFPIYFS